MRLPYNQQAGSLEVKMTPMIDVVFLLLIFFVWTSSFETPEFDLQSDLAELPAKGNQSATEPTPVEAFDEIVVKLSVAGDGVQIEMGGQTVESLDEVRAKVIQIVSLGVQPPVIIDPEHDVTMDRTVEVYDAVRAAGADRVLYAMSAE